jgi:hypothetical protein
MNVQTIKSNKMKAGDCVRVKPGVRDDYFEKYDYTGWQGYVFVYYDIEEDSTFSESKRKETWVEIEFDSITLKQMPEEYIIDSLKAEHDYAIMDFMAEELEAAVPRDTRDEVKKTRMKINKKYNYTSELDEEQFPAHSELLLNYPVNKN